MDERIGKFQVTFNEEKDYVACHHISRDMLLNAEEKHVAKTLATLSALAEQVMKERWAGYHKLYQKIHEQLNEQDDFPFDKEDLRTQLENLNDRVNKGELIEEIPLQLKRTG